VYPLPEAQRDRFLLKVLVPYPTPTEELEIINRMGVNPPSARAVLDPDELPMLQHAADRVFVNQGIAEYAVRLVLTTRDPGEFGLTDLAPVLDFGASPRASLGLVAATRALALLRGRDYAVPEDLLDVARDVLRHRLVLSFQALSDDITSDQILRAIIDRVPVPVVPLRTDERVGVGA